MTSKAKPSPRSLGKTAVIQVKVTPELKKQVAQRCGANQITQTSWVESLIKWHIRNNR